MAKTSTSRTGRCRGGRPPEGGFTLLELLIVLTVLVLVYAALPSGLFTGGGSVELRSAARKVAEDLRRARGQAIAGNQDTAFNLDLESRRFGIVGGGAVETLPQGVKVEFLTVAEELAGQNQGAIRFFPDGSSSGGRVTLSRDGQSYRVTVRWLTGEVRLVE